MFFKLKVLRALVSYFLGEIQCSLMLEMPLRRVLQIIGEFSKRPSEQLKTFLRREALEGYQLSAQKKHI